MDERRAAERLEDALVELARIQLELDHERLARRRGEELFDRILDSMNDAVVVTDPAGRIRLRNRSAELLGIGSDPSDRPDPVIETAWEILRTDPRGVHVREVTVEHDGRPMPLSVASSVIRDSHGKVVGEVSTARDLTDTQRLLDQVRRAEAHGRLLVRINDALASSVEPGAALPVLCRAISEAFAADARIVIVDGLEARIDSGGELAAGSLLPPRTAVRAAVDSGRTIAASDTTGYPLGVSGAAGAALVVPLRAGTDVHGVLVVARPGGPAFEDAVVELVEDVATRIGAAVANADLRASLEAAEREREAVEFRRNIAASLSHDMKTPLSTMLGAVQALRTGGLDPLRVGQLHELLHRQGNRLHRLVSQLLDFARLEAGHPLQLVKSSVALRPIVDAVLDEHPGRRFEVVCDPALPAVDCDPDRVQQVLANLVSNAVKYSPPDTAVEIELTAGTADDGHGHAETATIRVSDRGPGIEPADRARLFEQFRRGSTTAATEGSGLGLYLARALIEAHGGSICCEQTSSLGTTFAVTLPVRATPARRTLDPMSSGAPPARARG